MSLFDPLIAYALNTKAALSLGHTYQLKYSVVLLGLVLNAVFILKELQPTNQGCLKIYEFCKWSTTTQIYKLYMRDSSVTIKHIEIIYLHGTNETNDLLYKRQKIWVGIWKSVPIFVG